MVMSLGWVYGHLIIRQLKYFLIMRETYKKITSNEKNLSNVRLGYLGIFHGLEWKKYVQWSR